MLSFLPLACLLAHVEDHLCCLAQRALGLDWQVFAKQEAPFAARVASGCAAGLAAAGPRRYVVRYQLTAAELRDGQVVASYVAPCVRLFDTDELNVIWAELVEELGTSPYRLGLEILAIEVYPPPGRLSSSRWSGA